MPYFDPHSFRDMLVRHAMALDPTPEQMKAWSQNLGHADVLTTFTSYGSVPVHPQGELIRSFSEAQPLAPDSEELARAIATIQRMAGKNGQLPLG